MGTCVTQSEAPKQAESEQLILFGNDDSFVIRDSVINKNEKDKMDVSMSSVGDTTCGSPPGPKQSMSRESLGSPVQLQLKILPRSPIGSLLMDGEFQDENLLEMNLNPATVYQVKKSLRSQVLKESPSMAKINIEL